MENTMEKFIIGGNSSGKTRKMLEEAAKTGAIVICKNPYSLENKAKSYEIFGLKFISYEEARVEILKEEMFSDQKVAIDEIGDFVKYCCGAELDAFTMTV